MDSANRLKVFVLIIVLFFSKEAMGFTVAVFDAPEGHSHSKKILEIINPDESTKVKLLPIYDSSGVLTKQRMLTAIDSAREAKILHFSWNMEYSDDFAEFVNKLNELSAEGRIIVAAAGSGLSKGGGPVKVADTVMGKIKGAFIIGELNEQNTLPPTSTYGKEIFKSLRPPSGLIGSSFSAALFTKSLIQK